ncbi:MAG: twin-arginine translocase subunit TatC [Bacteroidales bacterium]
MMDHLEALRYALMRTAVVLMVAAVIVFLYGQTVYEVVILGPRNPGFLTNRLFCALGTLLEVPALCINQLQWSDVNLDLAGQFRFHLSLSINGALMLVVPYIVLELWWFVKPALYPREKKRARGFVMITTILFWTGALFGYFIVMPLAVNFLANYTVHPDIVNQFQLYSYVRILLSTVLSTGLIFEMPVLIWFLARMGLITPAMLKQYRKHVVVVLLILSAIITPPDVLSQFLVAGPLYLLFELGVRVAGRNVERDGNEPSV